MPDDVLARAMSFHYEGYNVDSEPEAEFLERVLTLITKHPDQIEGIWFTGGLTDPNKTELYAEYLGEDTLAGGIGTCLRRTAGGGLGQRLRFTV